MYLVYNNMTTRKNTTADQRLELGNSGPDRRF